MTKIDMDDNEIKAIDELLKDCKVPPEMGWVLTNLKMKIYTAWKSEQEEKQRELAKKIVNEDTKKKE